MPELPADHQVYAPPRSIVADTPRVSPRLRFWIASTGCFILAPTIFFGLTVLRAPGLAFPLAALVAWLSPQVWVLAAHYSLTNRFTFMRAVLVITGLSISMAVFSFLGMAIATLLFVDYRFE